MLCDKLISRISTERQFASFVVRVFIKQFSVKASPHTDTVNARFSARGAY